MSCLSLAWQLLLLHSLPSDESSVSRGRPALHHGTPAALATLTTPTTTTTSPVTDPSYQPPPPSPYFTSLFIYWLFRATPAASERSQARGRIGVVATGLHHSHCNSEPPQLVAMPDPRATERGQGWNPHPRGYESASFPRRHNGNSHIGSFDLDHTSGIRLIHGLQAFSWTQHSAASLSPCMCPPRSTHQ